MERIKTIRKIYPPELSVLSNEIFCLNNRLQSRLQIYQHCNFLTSVNTSSFSSNEKLKLNQGKIVNQNQYEFIFQGDNSLSIINASIQQFQDKVNRRMYGQCQSPFITNTIQHHQNQGQLNIWSQCQREIIDLTHIPRIQGIKYELTNIEMQNGSLYYPTLSYLCCYDLQQKMLLNAIPLVRQCENLQYIQINKDLGSIYETEAISLVDWRMGLLVFRKEVQQCRKALKRSQFQLMYSAKSSIHQIDIRMPRKTLLIMNGDNREETINNFVLVGNRLLISEGVLSSVYQ